MKPAAFAVLRIAVIFVIAGSTQAVALDGGWAETEGARMRLVVDPARDGAGSVSGVLDIELQPGWKTYWKDPGGSGIPPTIDLSGSKGITLEAMRLPAPVRVDDGYSTFAGYTQSVRFALEFAAPGAAQLEANVFIGVCEKICVPFQAAFSLAVPEPGALKGSDAVAGRLVSEAKAALPEAPSAEFSVGAPALDAAGKTLTVEAALPASPGDGTVDLFVAGPPGWVFATPELVARKPASAVFAVGVHATPKAADGRAGPLDLVVTHGARAVEVSRPVR